LGFLKKKNPKAHYKQIGATMFSFGKQSSVWKSGVFLFQVDFTQDGLGYGNF